VIFKEEDDDGRERVTEEEERVTIKETERTEKNSPKPVGTDYKFVV